MTTHYKVDTVSRVQAVLKPEKPLRQTISIRELTHREDCPSFKEIEALKEFPDETVSNGTRMYQIFQGIRVFEICVLRGL